jgi:hypothetical protein
MGGNGLTVSQSALVGTVSTNWVIQGVNADTKPFLGKSRGTAEMAVGHFEGMVSTQSTSQVDLSDLRDTVVPTPSRSAGSNRPRRAVGTLAGSRGSVASVSFHAGSARSA